MTVESIGPFEIIDSSLLVCGIGYCTADPKFHVPPFSTPFSSNRRHPWGSMSARKQQTVRRRERRWSSYKRKFPTPRCSPIISFWVYNREVKHVCKNIIQKMSNAGVETVRSLLKPNLYLGRESRENNRFQFF